MGKLFNIQNPCSEDWESMRIGIDSRLCENCQKNVVDFTNKSRKEIFEYLLANFNKKICVRAYASQLDFTYSDLEVTIHALSKNRTNSNLVFFILAIGSLMLVSCDTSPGPKHEIAQSETISKQDSMNSGLLIKKDADSNIILDDYIITGDLAPIYDREKDNCTIDPGFYLYVDTMPEYAGGFEMLTSFLQKNLKYPDWEKSKKIQGKIFVTFLVEKTGKIKDPKILKSVTGSKNFDKEVLRVINSMPPWVPGKKDGKNVDVWFTLPINFKL